MIISSVVLLVATLLQSSTVISNPVIIELESSSNSVEINKQLYVSVNITNTEGNDINDLHVSLTSPGLTIVQAPNFPETLSGYAQIRGFYTLKADTPGETMVWLSSIYLQNNSEQSLPDHQFSDITEPLTLNVNDNPNVHLTEIWTGSITTLLGAILGTVIPVLYRRFNRSREIESERRSSIEQAKSLLEYELEYNRKLIEGFQKCSVQKWNDVIRDYYYLISETPDLSNALLKLYSKLDDYNKIDDPALRRRTIDKNYYLGLIDEAHKLVKEWEHTKK